MLAVVRMYRSEEQARSAITAVRNNGVAGKGAHMLTPHTGDATAVVNAAIAAGQMPASHINVSRKALEQGQTVVSVPAYFGASVSIEEVLDGFDPVPTPMPEYHHYNPTPLSDILNLPVLTKYKHSINIKQTTRPSWFATSSGNGDGLISKKASPLSSMFGMKTLTSNKSKSSSFGLPLLSKKAAPLSSAVGMKTVSKPKSKNSSFGFRLLSKNPAPLSNMFNIPLLSKRSRGD